MTVTVRETLVQALEQDLIGPRQSDEAFPELPTVRYLTGILYPAGTQGDPAEDDERPAAADSEEGEAEDEPISVPHTFRQASIGLTLEAGADECEIEITYARYTQTGTGTDQAWVRQPYSWRGTVDFREGSRGHLSLDDEGAECDVLVRADGSTWVVTVFLVNRADPSEPVKDADCIFQPRIAVRTHVVARTERVAGGHSDPDTLRFQLLYRKFSEYAVGHGCAVTWTEDRDHAREVVTSLVPAFELPRVIHHDRPDLDGLDMMFLAYAADGTEVSAALLPVIGEYEDWIESKRAEARGLGDPLKTTGLHHLQECQEAAQRMRQGLELIRSDHRVFTAFRFANEVMAYQRARTEYAKAYKVTGKRPSKTVTPRGRWRPFQVAFILLNLTGVVDPGHADRSVADLLWFATGGGKTEAYLGLAAFVLGLRRLRGREPVRDHAGVTVLMRYTLRLLTVQQYQRAATMICACELLRRRDPGTWGPEPFLIGLWVGSNTTPNNIKDAREALDELAKGNDLKEANPVQLQNCPWCGQALDYNDYHVDDRRDWLLVHCSNPTCEFHGERNDSATAIPVLTVDEDIYHRCPSLLIGTVDKFARLPWNAKTAALFGLVTRRCPRHGFLPPAEYNHPANHRANRGLPATAVEGCPRLKPPELIIQDELHLIAGPLGTMVGHYETAIDYLCTLHGGVRPKVIASTATIRRAKDQVRQLFNRSLCQFPPPGLDSADSFFAKESSSSGYPGRKYIGVCATGKSGKTTMVRVFSCLLQTVKALESAGANPEDLDPYWTLTSYFNSMKELGAAVRLVEDDVPDRLGVLSPPPMTVRPLERVQELNSRRDASEIPSILSRMERDLSSGEALDVLLATNMISVGVDIDRLGLMVVQGQPKGTSEYIQATSRVGRKHPGLIVTMYNWSRPRDLSHYERFGSYHAMLYRYVEPTSVTPFSPRARDRGLRAILIGMARLADPTLARNTDARRVEGKTPALEHILAAIRSRVGALEPSELVALEAELTGTVDWWSGMSRRYRDEQAVSG